MDETIKRVNRTLVHKGSILDFYDDTIQMPNGNVEHWDFIHHKGAACVVAVKENGKILMVRQFRNALNRYTLELPAGARNFEGEDTRVCAMRELEEETGYRCDDPEQLLSLKSTVAFCDELIDVYLARNLIPSVQHLDENEFLNVVEMDFDELLNMIYSGKIQDSKTVAGLLAYQSKYLR